MYIFVTQKNNYKRRKPLEHSIWFKIVGHVVSVHFLHKYMFTLLLAAAAAAKRRHSQIRKKNQGPSIFTCPVHTINVHRDIIPSAANRGLNTQCLFHTVQQCTASQSVSDICRDSFGTVLFSLPLFPDCLHGVIFNGESLYHHSIIIVETIKQILCQRSINYWK